MAFDLNYTCILQAVETELFKLFVGRHLQKPRPTPIWRTRCWFKAYFVVCWGPRLHGPDKEIAGILREGNLMLLIFFVHNHRASYVTSFALFVSNSFCYTPCRWKALWSLDAHRMFLKLPWVPCLLWRRHWTSWLHRPLARHHSELNKTIWCGIHIFHGRLSLLGLETAALLSHGLFCCSFWGVQSVLTKVVPRVCCLIELALE